MKQFLYILFNFLGAYIFVYGLFWLSWDVAFIIDGDKGFEDRSPLLHLIVLMVSIVIFILNRKYFRKKTC
jgi:membrane protein DedA with SNARE-associated domain